MEITRAWNVLIGRTQNVHASGNALHTLGEIQAQIHQQHAFHYGAKLTMAGGALVWIAGKTGAKKVHFHEVGITAHGGGPIELDFYHGSVVTSGSGTDQNAAGNVHNRDLSVTSSSVMQIISAPTVTTTGSLIFPGANPASATIGGSAVGATASLLGGFILDANQTYLIGLKNIAVADTATVWANFGFSEPESD